LRSSASRRHDRVGADQAASIDHRYHRGDCRYQIADSAVAEPATAARIGDTGS
jgi:hypothetical protein